MPGALLVVRRADDRDDDAEHDAQQQRQDRRFERGEQAVQIQSPASGGHKALVKADEGVVPEAEGLPGLQLRRQVGVKLRPMTHVDTSFFLRAKGGSWPPFTWFAFWMRLLRGNILVDDGLDGAVRLELGQRLVQGFLQRGVVLSHADGVILVGVLGVQNGQTGVCLDVLLSRRFVDHDAVDLTGEQVLHGGRAVIKGNHAVLAVIIDAIAITGGAALGADLLAFEIINALDIGAFLHDDDLNAVGVAVGEAHGVLTLGRDGHAGGNDVALAGLDGAQSRVKVHIVDDQLQAQLLRQSVSDLDVDAFKAGALVALAVVRNGLVRRELRVGGHGELAGGHGLDVRARLGILLATGAQRCDHEDCQKQCNKFLHFISLFLKQNRLGLAPRLVWSYDSTRA